MRARNHVIASAGISLGMQAVFGSWSASLVCFLSGVFLDLDHILEYFLNCGRFPRSYKELKEFCQPYKYRKVYLLFHSYEYLLLLWILIYIFQLDLFWISLAIGITFHVFLDQISNPIQPLFYFIAYRFYHGFEAVKVLGSKGFGELNV